MSHRERSVAIEALRRLLEDVDELQRRLDGAYQRSKDLPTREVHRFLHEQIQMVDTWYEETKHTWNDTINMLDECERLKGIEGTDKSQPEISREMESTPVSKGGTERSGEDVFRSQMTNGEKEEECDQHSTYGARLYSIEKRMAAMGGVPALGSGSLPLFSPQHAKEIRSSLKSSSRKGSESSPEKGNDMQTDGPYIGAKCSSPEKYKDGKLKVAPSSSNNKQDVAPGLPAKDSELAAVFRKKGLTNTQES